MLIAVEILACTFVDISLDILLYRPCHTLLVMVGGVNTLLVNVLKQQVFHFFMLLL